MVTVINKIDYKYFDENLPEFYKLGETEMINISAEHDRNITELKDFIYKNIIMLHLIKMKIIIPK